MSVYHQAIRSSVYAFRTTPIRNLLAESGLPSIEERIYGAKFITEIITENNISKQLDN